MKLRYVDLVYQTIQKIQHLQAKSVTSLKEVIGRLSENYELWSFVAGSLLTERKADCFD